jgi:hypothetical protein
VSKSFCFEFLLFFNSFLFRNFIFFYNCRLVLLYIYRSVLQSFKIAREPKVQNKPRPSHFKSKSRCPIPIGPAIHLAAYKRPPIIAMPHRFLQLSINTSSLSLSQTFRSKLSRNPEKLKNNDEQVHHLQTLTVQNIQTRIKPEQNPRQITTSFHQFRHTSFNPVITQQNSLRIGFFF